VVLQQTDLQQFIVSTTVLEHGYSFMIDTAHSVIVHPRLTPGTLQSIEGAEFTDAAEAQAFEQLLDTVVLASATGATGSTNSTVFSKRTCGSSEYTKGGAQWLLAYCTVANTSYAVVLTVPVVDTTAAIVKLQRSNKLKLTIGTALMGGAVAVFLVLALCLSVRYV
jgi:hypothetical protein